MTGDAQHAESFNRLSQGKEKIDSFCPNDKQNDNLKVRGLENSRAG
jgi:hypothetical protein